MMGSLLRRLAGGLILALALVLFSLPTAHAATIVDVTDGDTPGAFIFSGSGFDASEKVTFSITGPNEAYTVLSERESSGSGNVQLTRQLPRYLQAGAWTVTLRGEDSRMEASAAFDMPVRGPNAEVGLSQTSGTDGAALRVTSRDFDDGETVFYWLTGPDGLVHGSGSHETSEGSDGMRFTYTLDAGSPSGAWKMSVYGSDSDRLAIAPFVIG
jgi:hypothetical protein